MTNSYIIATSNLHFEKPVGRGCSYYKAEMLYGDRPHPNDSYNFILLMDEDYDFRILERLQRANDYLRDKNIKILLAGERKGTITVVLSSLLPSVLIKAKIEQILSNGREGDEWNVNVYFEPLNTEEIYDDRLSMLAHPEMPKKVYKDLISKVVSND